MSDRLISADRFKNWLMDNYILYDGDRSLKDIDEQPTVDAVPVIRCKDCKFYRKTNATTMDYFDYIKGNTENKKPLYMCDNDVIDWATPEDYCSLGVRRENAK